MTRDHSNPFVLPGLGQSGAFAANPVMASMEMMRQAWQSLAEQGGLGAPSMAATLSAEDLERRITDLRAVENWLRMNLTVLSSTIQGLEVQRATLATFKSFVSNAAAAEQDASMLERFFGVKPASSAQTKTAPRQTASDPAQSGQTTSRQSASDQAASDQTRAQQAGDAARGAAFDADQAVAATQAWWDMLRRQFDSLAAATAANMPPAGAAPSTDTTAASADAAATSPAKSPRASAAGKPKAGKPATKSAPRRSRSSR